MPLKYRPTFPQFYSPGFVLLDVKQHRFPPFFLCRNVSGSEENRNKIKAKKKKKKKTKKKKEAFVRAEGLDTGKKKKKGT